MAQAGFQQAVETTLDIPLQGMPLLRGTGTNGQRFVNVLFERIQNPLTGGSSLYTIKRPGLANNTQPPAGAATGRGIHYWEGSGKLYSVFNNKIYSDGTDLGVTLAGSTGKVWFTETAPTSSTRLLIVSDGADNYNIQTNDTITQIDETDDVQYPTSNVGCIVFLNGYLFQAQEDGEIWNTDPDAFTSWTGTAVEDADAYGDELVAIAKVRDQLVVFGKYSTEFYFDNGTTPTPLLRISQNSLAIGMAHKNTMGQAGDSICWVSESPAIGEGGRAVWLMEGTNKVSKVSTPVIERFLNAETTTISTSSAWMERIHGHLLYVINLDSTERTFVYDVDLQVWYEWSGTTITNKFPIIDVTSQNGVIYGIDAANGRTSTFSNTTYQDNGTNFTVRLQTDNYDFGTPFNKFQSGLWIIGDNVAVTTVEVSEADDDYTTFNTARNMDFTNTRKFLSEGGAFVQRAYRIDFTSNNPFRVQKMVLKLDVGDA